MRWRSISSPPRSGVGAGDGVRGVRWLPGIAALAAIAGCAPAERPTSAAPSPPAVPTEEVFAGPRPSSGVLGPAPRHLKDGPPLGGPSREALMQVPDAVPEAEPRSPHGNPPVYAVDGQLYRTLPTGRGYVERGIASWYGRKFHRRPTSSREPYDMFAMTAAHRSLPLPTYVRVTHLENGRSAVVRINDRGPFHPGRIIDLSYTAAVKLGIADPGSGPVEVRALDPGGGGRGRPRDRAVPESAEVTLYVQVGVYSNEANARRALDLAARLRPGLALLSRTGREERALHRVRIGPLSGLEEADRVMAGLHAAGMPGARVVIETPDEETAENGNA